MKCVMFSLGLGFLFAITPAHAVNPPASTPLECKSGPVNKTFGGTAWLVYSCSDDHSLAFITPNGSEAFPFYFFYSWENGTYRLVGEGTGRKDLTDAAYTELKALSASEIAALIAQTKAR